MRRVRRANQDDVPTLSRFRYAFRSQRRQATEPESEFIARCAEWMRPRLRSDSRWRVFLLEQGGEAIGNIWLQMIEKIPNPGDEWELHGYITNFFVLPEHRNTGAGSMLLSAAVDDCRALHADSIFLWPSDDSKPLYLRNGFTPAASMMLMKL
jgi:GNAT superfamily N-acetyltransferase